MGKLIPIHVHVPPYVHAWLDQRVVDGSFESRNATVRSILECVVDDDLRAHGEEIGANVVSFPLR